MQANPRWGNVDFRSIYRLVFRFDLGVYLDFNLILGYLWVHVGASRLIFRMQRLL